jgi:hypothetical protein
MPIAARAGAAVIEESVSAQSNSRKGVKSRGGLAPQARSIQHRDGSVLSPREGCPPMSNRQTRGFWRAPAGGERSCTSTPALEVDFARARLDHLRRGSSDRNAEVIGDAGRIRSRRV